MSPTRIKVCGVTREADAASCVRAGVDLLGLNFWPSSKRYVDLQRAQSVARSARQAGEVLLVGVFVNQTESLIEATARRVGLDYVQLHGDESAEMCERISARVIKAIAIGSPADAARAADYATDLLLVDTPSQGYGGSGQVFDWSLVMHTAASRPTIVAGGLTAANVDTAIRQVRPWGVDVASGVESSPGHKSVQLVNEFVQAVRRCDDDS